MVRLIWAFAIACVVAATSVVPEIETRDQARSAQIERAPATPQLLATRGAAARSHAVRLPVFTLVERLSFDAPLRAVVAVDSAPHAAPFSVTEVPRSARGPPIG